MPSPRLRRTHNQTFDSQRMGRRLLLKLQPVPTTDGAPAVFAQCTACCSNTTSKCFELRVTDHATPAVFLIAQLQYSLLRRNALAEKCMASCMPSGSPASSQRQCAKCCFAMLIMNAGSNAQSMPTQRVVGPCCSCSGSRTTQRMLHLSVAHSNRQSTSAGPPAMPVTARSALMRLVRALRRPQHSPSSQIWTMTMM